MSKTHYFVGYDDLCDEDGFRDFDGCVWVQEDTDPPMGVVRWVV